ncbi:MAG: hypothetical protein RL260_2220 [Pseudomonadota bacterium]|jgi:ribosomal protein S18 acetylase RimI-like enzyme
MTLTYRPAVPEDADACVDLRGRTRENAFSVSELANIGVTRDTWCDGIADGSLPGHVCLDDGQMVGYCFGAPETGEVIVLALLPAWEDRGIGRVLLGRSEGALLRFLPEPRLGLDRPAGCAWGRNARIRLRRLKPALTTATSRPYSPG